MEETKKIFVTGGFGYSGKYIIKLLLSQGKKVATLTNSLHKPDPFRGEVESFPFFFNNPEKLTEILQNCKILINTFWIRYNNSQYNFCDALQCSKILIDCAKKAGVEKIIHISTANVTPNDPYEYYCKKFETEQYLIQSGLNYGIVRPTVLFGHEDILINNIAWAIRRFPVIGYFGSGDYPIQPLHVDDLAEIVLSLLEEPENRIINAAGPDVYVYKDLLTFIAQILRRKRWFLSLPPKIAYFFLWIAGLFVHDKIVTEDEIYGLMAGKLAINGEAQGTRSLTEWMLRNSRKLGKNYESELQRRTSS